MLLFIIRLSASVEINYHVSSLGCLSPSTPTQILLLIINVAGLI